MAIDTMTDLMRQVLLVALMVMAPPLLTALVLGLCVGLLQAVTSIQEQTLSFVPKIVGIVVMVIMLGPWMLRTLVDMASGLFSRIAELGTI
jgi:flagellar biosynthesis protein FliQ